MPGIFSRLKEMVSPNEPADYDYDYDDDGDSYQNPYQQEPPQPNPEEERRQRRRMRDRVNVVPDTGVSVPTMNNVIGMPGVTSAITEVLVLEPRTFEEMPQAIQALRERKSVVLNLTMMDPDQAQRAVDFIAGGTYALDGHQERIGESIFLFTPSCVQVSTQAGVVHEVAQAQVRAPRSTTPAPAWATEPRIVQSN